MHIRNGIIALVLLSIISTEVSFGGSRDVVNTRKTRIKTKPLTCDEIMRRWRRQRDACGPYPTCLKRAGDQYWRDYARLGCNDELY